MPWQRLQSDFRFALITLFGGLTSLFLLPIAAYRFATGATITGVVDLAVVAFITGSVIHVWRGGCIERAGLIAAGMASLGVIVVARSAGLSGLLWAYPLVVASFLLVRPRQAMALSAATIIAVALAGRGFETGYMRLAFAITGIVVGIFAYIFAYRTETQRVQLQMLVTRDTLTSASNRRAMEQEMPIAMEASRRTGVPVCLAVLDIDHFKRINDSYGHETGDHVLVDFVRLVGDATRRGDRLFRYGGEEFVLLLPGMDAAALESFAETLRARIAGELNVGGQPVTVSIGGAEFAPAEPANEWLARADAAMYRAKREGRDRVVVAATPASIDDERPARRSDAGASR